MSKAFYILACW